MIFYDRFWTKISDHRFGLLLCEGDDGMQCVTVRVGQVCVRVGAEAWIGKEWGLDPSWADRLPEMWHHVRGIVDGRRGYRPRHGRRPGAGDSVPRVRERQPGDLPRLGEQNGGRMKLQYETLAELQQGYKSGEKLDPITLDNDQTSVYTASGDDEGECVFELHPDQLLEQALDLLGIPHQEA